MTGNFKILHWENLNGPQDQFRPGSKLLASAISLFCHAIFIAAVVWLPPGTRLLDRSAADTQRTPLPFPGKKIIWYRFNELPQVAPAPEMTRAPLSQAPFKRRRQTVLTEVPLSADDQFVWTPVERPNLEPEIRLPDLIQTELPPPPKPAKLFRPSPKEIPATPNELMLAEPEALQITGIVADSPKLPVSKRRFIAPPPAGRAVVEVQMLVPSMDVPAVATNASVAAISLNAEHLAAPPPVLVSGVRTGDASSAQIKGSVATGNRTPAIGGVPGVAVERPDNNAGVRPATAKPGREIVYQTARLGSVRNSLSVPMRPFARAVPPYIEAHFTRRNVYTVLLPMFGMAEYGSDWVLWFGERNPNPSIGRVKAPLPKVKRQVRDSQLTGTCCQPVRIRALLLISKNGRISEVKIFSVSAPHAALHAEEDLLAWEFTPATRDGQPIDADAVVEFTLRTPIDQSPSVN